MSEIVEATTADLLDIAANGECACWQIAVWPVLATEVPCTDADQAASTDAVVLWKSLVDVYEASGQLVIKTERDKYRLAPGHRTFVIREAS
ncbi:hypothetical protein K1W54_04300 [Micromonospora sp. CPCC 205371]|nr:hypothetical protein [Micromonospora sp. CPCC 205371]